jgi:hypothetical protein
MTQTSLPLLMIRTELYTHGGEGSAQSQRHSAAADEVPMVLAVSLSPLLASVSRFLRHQLCLTGHTWGYAQLQTRNI